MEKEQAVILSFAIQELALACATLVKEVSGPFPGNSDARVSVVSAQRMVEGTLFDIFRNPILEKRLEGGQVPKEVEAKEVPYCDQGRVGGVYFTTPPRTKEIKFRKVPNFSGLKKALTDALLQFGGRIVFDGGDLIVIEAPKDLPERSQEQGTPE